MSRSYRAGLDHYDRARDAVDHVLDKVLPDEPAPVHAVAFNEYDPATDHSEPLFLEPYDYRDSLCGRNVKVLLPIAFDPDDPDVCQQCAVRRRAGAGGPPEGRSRQERDEAEYASFEAIEQPQFDGLGEETRATQP